MSPYRTDMVVREQKQEFGLIIAPKAYVHECRLPRLLFHLWMWMRGQKVENKSLYRCTCGKVFQYIAVIGPLGSWCQ